MKNNKGITLIALVVTIVVLLILAGISISIIFGDNGLTYKANKSKIETKAATVEETRDLWMNERYLSEQTGESKKTMEAILQELQEDGVLTAEEVESIKNNENNEITIGSKTISFKVSDEGENEEKSSLGQVKIGDYVSYTPDVVSEEEIAKINDYVKKYSGMSNNNEVKQIYENLKWRVLDIDINGIITLISSGDTSDFYLQGPTGYNNGVKLLNTICNTYYSNKSLGATARNLNREDVEKYVDKDKFNSEGPIGKYYEPYTRYKYYPNIYPLENNYSSKVKNQIDGVDTAGTLLRSEQPDWIEGSYTVASISIRPVGMGYMGKGGITQTNHIFNSDIYYELLLKDTSGFWLSTREFNPQSNTAGYTCWVIGCASSDYVGGTILVDVSTGGVACKMVRPMVFISSNIECKSGDGSPENPWQIK